MGVCLAASPTGSPNAAYGFGKACKSRRATSFQLKDGTEKTLENTVLAVGSGDRSSNGGAFGEIQSATVDANNCMRFAPLAARFPSARHFARGLCGHSASALR